MKLFRFLALWLFVLPSWGSAQSDEDRGYLQGLIEDSLSGAGRDVRITGFEGALSSTATIAELTVADDEGVWLTMTDARLDWRRAALLRGRFDVNSLSAESVTLNRLPTANVDEVAETGFELAKLPPPQATAFSLPELPVSVRIGEVRIGSVKLAQPVIGEAAELAVSGTVELIEGEGDLSLDILRTDDQQGEIRIAGRYSNSSELLSLFLSVREPENGLIANLVDLPDKPSLDLQVEGEGPLTGFRADIELRTDNQDRLNGFVSFGTLTSSDTGETEQRFSAELTGDISPLLEGEYRDFLGASVELDVQGVRGPSGGLTVNPISVRSSALNLAGEVELAADGWPQVIDIAGSIAPPTGERILLAIPGPATRLASADFKIGFDADRGDEWQLLLRAEQLTRDAFALASGTFSGAGSLRPRSDTSRGRVDGVLELDVSGLDLGDDALTTAVGSDLAGTLGFTFVADEPLDLRDIDIRGADYGVVGDLAIDLPENSESPVITADLNVVARDVSRFAGVAGRELSGTIGGEISGTLVPLDGAFDLEIDGRSQHLAVGIERLDPLIAGAGELSVAAVRDFSGIRLDRFSVVTPQADISGRIDVTLSGSQGKVAARLNEASVLHPDMSGEVVLNVEFDQQGQRINGDLIASGPGGVQLDLAAKTPVDSSETRIVASLQAGDLSPYSWIAQRPISGGLDAQISGQGDVVTQVGALELSGTAQDLRFDVPEADALLAGTAEFNVAVRGAARGAFVVDTLTFTAPRLIADISGSVIPDRIRFRYNLDVPDMAVLISQLPGPFAAEGFVLNVGESWEFENTIRGPGNLRLASEGNLSPDFKVADATLKGAVPLALANRQLEPNILSGAAQLDLAIDGPIALDSVSGQIGTSGARMTLPQLRMALNDISGTVSLNGAQAQTNVSVNLSTGGQVTASGPVALTPPFNGNLAIKLESVGVEQAGILETTADGRLTIAGPLAGGAQVTGTITTDDVNVQIPSFAGTESARLPGLVHKHEPAAVRRTRARAGLIEKSASDGNPNAPPYGIDVLLSVPRIFVRGRGLDAELGGDLQLGGTTEAISPTGQFELMRGRLNILGQRLDLTEGYIQPEGDLNVFLRIVAQATAGSTDVQFVIEGPVSEPELKMTSSPELPEDEILSRFLFGRDLTQISGLQALQIANALAQLSGRGPGAFETLREGIGLDDLDVSTNSEGETTVRAGKYISESVYSDIARTGDGETEINLNITLTPSITARGTARSDNSTSIGIFFEGDY